MMYVYAYTHTHTHTMGYYSVLKKKEILPFVTTWMKLKGIIVSELSQTEEDKCRMMSVLLYGITNTQQTKFIDVENRLLVARDWGVAGGKNR